MVKVEISTAIWYCGLWQFYVCKEHLKSRPGSVTYRYQQKTKKTKIKMVFFNTLLLIFVDVGWVARHIIAITPEKWWNQYRRKITCFNCLIGSFCLELHGNISRLRRKTPLRLRQKKLSPMTMLTMAMRVSYYSLNCLRKNGRPLNSVRSSSYYYHVVQLPFSCSLWIGTRLPGFLD